jgi:hypothetical protein
MPKKRKPKHPGMSDLKRDAVITELLTVDGLTKPDYSKLNVHRGRNDRLLHACLCAYAKHHLDCEDIGWNQLSDILYYAIVNELGDDEFIRWGERIKATNK